MLAAAGVLVACLLLVSLVLPPAVAGAAWPARAPVLGLLLWQAAGLAGGLLTLLLLATIALAPLGDTHVQGLRHLDRAGVVTWVAGAVGLLLLLRLLGVLLVSTWRTLRARRSNRLLVDLVSERNLLLRGASVLDHALPVAYCLPGLRPRLVLSRGALSLLSYDELRAVLAHEEAHLRHRHDLVVLPFVALGATFPALPAVRTAGAEVSLLIELLADDRAARHHERTHLARALWKIGTAEAPSGALGAGGEDVLLRARRLLDPPAPLSLGPASALVALAVVVAASPLLGIAVPLLV
ncbi:MAG: peptidase Ste24p [Frankiales bacterium]|nr:peptidase Ste24p [Frankiales bacterium]